tara:strand:- start:229 stop:402 length:174 start_codon:yes stop_codon:yes gene_type:complete
MTMVIREYQGSVIDVTEMMHELTNLEKQYQQAKKDYRYLGNALKTKRQEVDEILNNA